MQVLPKIVLERLKRKIVANQHDRESPIENRQCPDANLLAAFVEKTLSKRERTEVLDHLSHCADCREVVALTLSPIEVARPHACPPEGGGASGRRRDGAR